MKKKDLALIENRIKNFLFVINDVENNITSVDDIFNNQVKYAEQFELHVCIDLYSFKELMDKGLIVKDKINKAIELNNIINNYLYTIC
jgi:hypothetical protein